MVIIFSLFIINELLHSIYSLWQKNDLIVQTKQELNIEKKRNSELLSRLKVVDQPQFIEEEARNKLFMAKPGEGIMVVAPSEYTPASSSADVVKLDKRSNWQKWVDAFSSMENGK